MAKKPTNSADVAEAHNLQLLLEDSEIPFVQGSTKGVMKELGAKSQDLWFVPLDEINVYPNFNPRVESEERTDYIRWLADQMKMHGFKRKHPLSVIVTKEEGKDKIYLTDGHTRYAAAKLARSEGADIEVCPVVSEPAGKSMEDLTFDLVLANSGEKLKPIELAIVCKRLVNFGNDSAMIAEKLGMSGTYVDNLLMLAAAPLQIRKMVMGGQVAANHAIEMMRKHGTGALALLEAQLQKAQAEGKDKIKPSQSPERLVAKKMTKAAPKMFETFGSLRTDPGYNSLSPELRSKIEDLLHSIDQDMPGLSQTQESDE